MKFVNKKRIQQLYREQMQNKRDKEMNFIETILMIFIVLFLIIISHFFN